MQRTISSFINKVFVILQDVSCSQCLNHKASLKRFPNYSYTVLQNIKHLKPEGLRICRFEFIPIFMTIRALTD